MSYQIPLEVVDASGGTASASLGSPSVGAVGNNNTATIAAMLNGLVQVQKGLVERIEALEGGDAG